jgi:hypothetical protein
MLTGSVCRPPLQTMAMRHGQPRDDMEQDNATATVRRCFFVFVFVFSCLTENHLAPPSMCPSPLHADAPSLNAMTTTTLPPPQRPYVALFLFFFFFLFFVSDRDTLAPPSSTCPSPSLRTSLASTRRRRRHHSDGTSHHFFFFFFRFLLSL